jgi:hypothetical protein
VLAAAASGSFLHGAALVANAAFPCAATMAQMYPGKAYLCACLLRAADLIRQAGRGGPAG